jgi:hypothetical protein
MTASLRWWNLLDEFGASLSPLFLSITGAGWTVAGGVLLWGILVRKAWARRAAFLSMTIWLLEYWVERLYFQAQRANLIFALTASILLLTVTFASAFNTKTRNYLTGSEDHEQPDEDKTPA